MITTETVFVDSPSQTKVVTVSKEVEGNKTAIIILVAVLSIFTLAVTGVCVRYILMKKTQEKLDIELTINRVNQEIHAKE